MIAVLVPAYNAGTTIGRLLERLMQHVPREAIVVVDDGSEDGTGEVARQAGVNVLRHPANAGKGAALKTGLNYVKTQGGEVEAVVTLDADLQHRPEDLPKLIAGWKNTKANIVVGWRQRWGTAMPLERKLSNSITSWLVSARTRQRILDSQCGYRLVERKVLDEVDIVSPGFEAETEFLIKAAERGLTITWVPIQTVYDREKSAMTPWQTTRNFLKVLLQGT